MSSWAPKRFWQNATVAEAPGGFRVLLDGREVRTPSKTPLIVPTQAMAEAIAAEWQAQDTKVRPETMPFTRSANSALDKVTPQFTDVADIIAAYGASDLLCYRAGHPKELVARQAAAWDPLLDWAAAKLDAPLTVTTGIVPVEQPAASVAALSARVHALTPFQLAGFHDLVAISGSLVLGFAISLKEIDVTEGWALSRVDETWQVEQWGEDEEATASEAVRKDGMMHAARFFALCG
jgi:chaperone required for assembly of F1-ATPase